MKTAILKGLIGQNENPIMPQGRMKQNIHIYKLNMENVEKRWILAQRSVK